MSVLRPPFHTTIGASFIGFSVSCVWVVLFSDILCLATCLNAHIVHRLYGILTLQTYAYFDRFIHDRKLYKNLVFDSTVRLRPTDLTYRHR